MEIKYVTWKTPDGERGSFALQTPKGYLRLSIFEGEFIELQEESKIKDVEITILGKLVVGNK